MLFSTFSGYKNAQFISRLVCFHLTGAPVEALERHMPVVSAMWHEAVRGRKAPEVTSAWLRILMEHRDHSAITVWSDNCLGQNKNYFLYTALVQLVNSEEVAFNSITLKYFEPGECNIYMNKPTIQSFATLMTSIFGGLLRHSNFGISSVRKAMTSQTSLCWLYYDLNMRLDPQLQISVSTKCYVDEYLSNFH